MQQLSYNVQERAEINVKDDRYPCCLVWTPIPVLTWFFPFVGHMGICTSSGIIYDFAGPYYIGEGELAFGRATRYIQLHPGVTAQAWDDAVFQANSCYAKKMHNICCQNCHSHCAAVLDLVGYKGFRHWNMVILAIWMFIAGKFVSVKGILCSLLPSVLIWGFIIAASVHAK
jgi:hypothetical protein